MKYKNINTGLIYNTTGRTEKKTVMGKEFILAQCTKSDGTCCLVPINRLSDSSLYKKLV